ncbi:hypothetical protein VPHK367G1_0011 [Vibrio phage K367 g1]
MRWLYYFQVKGKVMNKKNTIHNRRAVLICTGDNNCLRE